MAAQVFQGINLKVVEEGLSCLDLTTKSVIQMGRKTFAKHVKEGISKLAKSKINPDVFRDHTDRLCFK